MFIFSPNNRYRLEIWLNTITGIPVSWNIKKNRIHKEKYLFDSSSGGRVWRCFHSQATLSEIKTIPYNNLLYATLLYYIVHALDTLTGLVSDGRDDGRTVLRVELVAAIECKFPATARMVENLRRGQGGDEALVMYGLHLLGPHCLPLAHGPPV